MTGTCSFFDGYALIVHHKDSFTDLAVVRLWPMYVLLFQSAAQTTGFDVPGSSRLGRSYSRI